MDLTVSRPIKILALVLVLSGVAGIASLSMLGKSSGAGTSAPPLSVDQIRARAHKQSGVTTPAHRVATTHHVAVTPPKPVHVAPKPATKPAPTTGSNGLPAILDDALHAHRIVVVSVFDPQSQTDAVSYAEARAGADEATAGFLGVSVLDDTVAGPLTAALPGGGLLPVPGILVYRRPGTLVERIDGFVDRDSVAALAAAAVTAPALTTAPAPASTAPAPAVPIPAPVATDTTSTTP